MVDDKLAREEAQRAANYEAIKSNVKTELLKLFLIVQIFLRFAPPTKRESHLMVKKLFGELRDLKPIQPSRNTKIYWQKTW